MNKTWTNTSITYHLISDEDTNGVQNRKFNHIAKDATAEQLATFGTALAALTGKPVDSVSVHETNLVSLVSASK